MDIISKKEAKVLGLKRYYTGESCLHGHVVERFISNRRCVQCVKESSKKWKKENPEHNKEINEKWAKENPEYLSEYHKEWYQKNPEYNQNYYQENIESFKIYQKENQYKRTAYQKKRESSKLQRTPIWADFKKIEEVYLEVARLTKETGIQYTVDHIVPLQGKLVSGLHVENNLQVMTKRENCKKSSKWEVY